MTAVQRQNPPSRDIIPLPLDEVEVSIVVLPSDGTAATTTLTLSSRTRSSSSIVPFRRLLAAPDATDDELQPSVTSTSSSSGSMSLAIVPRDSTMLGVVMSSAVRRRIDDVPLPTVSCAIAFMRNQTVHATRVHLAAAHSCVSSFQPAP